jgi:positive regulator of sigma E activity
MPLIVMIAGYFVAERVASGIIPIIAAFACFGVSFLLIWLADRTISRGTSFYPVITGIIDNSATGESSCHN